MVSEHAMECVCKDDAEALLMCREVNVYYEYRDMRQGTVVTLLGLSIMRRATKCMRVLLMEYGVNTEDVCLKFGVQFLRTAVPLTMTGRKFAKTHKLTRDVLAMCDLRRAQLSAMQWVLVNIPACWRDLSEDVLRRLRYA